MEKNLQEYKDRLSLDMKFIELINTLSKLEILPDPMVGSLYVLIGEIVIYATPFWEDCDGLAIEVYNDFGEVLDSKDIDFNVTGDIEKDATLYVELLENYINEKKY